MAQYRYFRGSKDSFEAVEFDVTKDGGSTYITTCVINVCLLLAGVTAFPCGNGDDIKLTSEQQLEVLEYLQAERKKITEGEAIKSLDGWHKSGLHSWEEYCKPGELVTEDIVDEFTNSVPPTTLRSGYVQAGEACSSEQDDDGVWRDTYTTFTYHGKDGAGRSLWLHNGYCFKNGTDNKASTETSLERRIEAAFEEQQKANEDGWGLVLVMPQEVLDASQHLGHEGFHSRAEEDISGGAYAKGYRQGKEFDPTKRLAGEEAMA